MTDEIALEIIYCMVVTFGVFLLGAAYKNFKDRQPSDTTKKCSACGHDLPKSFFVHGTDACYICQEQHDKI